MRKTVVLLLCSLALILAGCESNRPPPPQDWSAPPPPQVTKPPKRTPAKPQMPPGKPGNAELAKADVYMDKQEIDLRRGLRNRGVLVARQGDTLIIILKSDVVFGPNSTQINDDSAVTLRGIANVIRYYDHTTVEVDGFSDTIGDPAKNMTLSQKRADSVLRALTSGGVNAKRVTAKGFGETRLKIPTGDNKAEPRNRRVEIRLSPLLPA